MPATIFEKIGYVILSGSVAKPSLLVCFDFRGSRPGTCDFDARSLQLLRIHFLEGATLSILTLMSQPVSKFQFLQASISISFVTFSGCRLIENTGDNISIQSEGEDHEAETEHGLHVSERVQHRALNLTAQVGALPRGARRERKRRYGKKTGTMRCTGSLEKCCQNQLRKLLTVGGTGSNSTRSADQHFFSVLSS